MRWNRRLVLKSLLDLSTKFFTFYTNFCFFPDSDRLKIAVNAWYQPFRVWQPLTWAPELNFWDSATRLRQCFCGNQVLDRRKKYRWLGTILGISLFQRSLPIADIFGCNPRFNCCKNSTEMALLSLKNWARELISKVTTYEMIRWGHINFRCWKYIISCRS